jgi:hypothetical protein
MLITDHLSSASVDEVTNTNYRREQAMTTAISTSNIQHREEQAMSTSTTEVKPGLVFREEVAVNNRLKVARMAKHFSEMEGVKSASVGTLSATSSRGEPNRLINHNLVEVCYDLMDCYFVGSFSPFTVVRAYYDRDENLVGATFRTNPYDAQDYHFYADYRPVLLGVPEITVAGETYDRYAVQKALNEALGYHGDQYGVALAKSNAKREEQERLEKHKAAISAAYAEREETGRADYRGLRPLYKAEDAGVKITSIEELRAHARGNDDALKALRAQWYTELFGYCQLALGKLRTEVEFLYDGTDPYGFVTPAEVSNYILTRWVSNGWGNDERAIRAIIAQEFVSDNF